MPSARRLAQHERLLQPVAGNAELVRCCQLRPAHVCLQPAECPSRLALPGRNTRAAVWRKHTEATRQTAPIPNTVMARALPRSAQPSKSHVNRHQETPSLVAIPLQIWNTPVRSISCMVFSPALSWAKNSPSSSAASFSRSTTSASRRRLASTQTRSAPIRQTVTNDEGFLEAIVSSPFGPKAAAFWDRPESH